MRKRLWIALSLFIILALSTLLFSGYVTYRNYQLDTHSGNSLVTGLVIDEDGRPIDDVEVTWKDIIVTTRQDGKFSIEDVDVGISVFGLYKPGYVNLEVTRLIYPEDEFENDIESSPNNISSDDDLVLIRELERMPPKDRIMNGTVRLTLNADDQLKGSGLFIGNGSGERMFITLEEGINRIDLDGDGTILISENEQNDGVIWRYKPGEDLDITGWVEELLGAGDPFTPPLLPLMITLEGNGERDGILLEVNDPLEGSSFLRIEDFDSFGTATIEIPTGISTITLSGREIRDREYYDILVLDGENTTIVIEVVPAVTEKRQEGLSLTWNYILAATYVLLAGVFLLGAYLVRNGKKWAYLLVIALIGFLIKGLFIGPLNLNLVLSSVIVLILFFSREDFESRRKKEGKVNKP